MRGTDFDFFGTRQIETWVHSQSSAVGYRWSADAAAKGVKSGFAFRIEHSAPSLTFSSSVVVLASSYHSSVRVFQSVFEFPGISSSSSILSLSAEESIISKVLGTNLMTV